MFKAYLLKMTLNLQGDKDLGRMGTVPTRICPHPH